MNSLRIIILLAYSLTITACTTPSSSQLINLEIDGKQYSYRSQRCTPDIDIKDSFISIDGLVTASHPNKNVKFLIDDNHSNNALNKINASLTLFRTLVNSTCQTLSLLSKPNHIYEYSIERDQILKDLILYLTAIDGNRNTEDVINLSKSQSLKYPRVVDATLSDIRAYISESKHLNFSVVVKNTSASNIDDLFVGSISAPSWPILFDKICTQNNACISCTPNPYNIDNALEISSKSSLKRENINGHVRLICN